MNNNLNILDLSSQLLMKFVENDNKKIILCFKRIYNFYNKYLYKRKQRYFFEFYNNLLNLSQSKNNKFKNKSNNIHNRLFNCSLMKPLYLRELENKFNQNEEKICTFSPKTNKGKIKCLLSEKNKNNELLEININNHRFSYSFKSDNSYNKIDKNNRYLFSKFIKTNQTFYHNNSFNGKYANNNKLLKEKIIFIF